MFPPFRSPDQGGSADKLTGIYYAFANAALDVNGQIVCKLFEECADYQVPWTAEQSVNAQAVTWPNPILGNFHQLKALKEMYPNVKENFTALLAEFRRQIDNINPGLLLTVATPAGEARTQISLNEIQPYLDFINVMTYDFHGAWDSQTGFLANRRPGPPLGRGKLVLKITRF